MPKAIDLTGCTFGRWNVIKQAPHRGVKRYWFCRCSCGVERAVKAFSLTSGDSRSCGCLRDEVAARTFITHGGCRTPEYNSWQTAKERCHNPNATQYADYGGRGIYVCDEWRHDFAAFIRDMGPRPTAKHTLDRIDNGGPYAPHNCRWATRAEQNRNSRRNRLIAFNGITLTITDWAQRLGFDGQLIRTRLDRCGWSVERALTTPPLWTRKRKAA